MLIFIFGIWPYKRRNVRAGRRSTIGNRVYGYNRIWGSNPHFSAKLLKNRLISSGFSFFTHEKSTNFHGLFPIQKEKHPVKSGNFQRGQKEENRLSFLRSAGFYRPAFFYLCAVWFKYLSSLSFAIGTVWLHPSCKRPSRQAERTKQISVFSSLSCLISVLCCSCLKYHFIKATANPIIVPAATIIEAILRIISIIPSPPPF